MIEPTSRLFASIAIAVAALGRALAAPPIPNPDALPIGVSRVLWEISVPADVAPTPQKVALGEKLFNDVRLSTNDKVSCATCHDPAKGFVDGKPLAEGVAAPKEKTKRHSPTVLNAVFNATQFWDGRAATLEDQAKLPITNPIEMGQKDGQAVMTKVLAIPEYATAFKETFGREGTFDDLAAAIAAFERTQVSSQAAFDRFVAGDENAISPAAKRGWGLFNGKARCNTCHAFSTTNPTFSDQRFHNIGIAAHKTDFIELARRAVGIVKSGDLKQIDEIAIQSDLTELGRFLVTKHANDVGAFKTPGLRDIAVTAPYMHDGSLATLEAVVKHYTGGFVARPGLATHINRKLRLSGREKADLIAFLRTLSSEPGPAHARRAGPD